MLKTKTTLKYLINTLFILVSCSITTAQTNLVVDKIIAQVGDEIILKSDLETQLAQYQQSGYTIDDEARCIILEELLIQNLMLDQAKLDSIEVSEEQIQGEIDRRLRYFIAQFGSQEALEKFYHKSILEIKAEFHDLIKNQLLIQQMQNKILGEVKITPAEVRKYFNNIPKDSLPYINAQVELAQIVKKPVISESEKSAVREKLNGIRNRILNGEDFGTLAYLYSEDPGSAKNNGELGFLPRTALVKEFAKVAFSLKEGEVSEIVETEYGFHIIQLIEKKGEEANFRHILLKPKVNPYALLKAKQQLDSIKQLIETSDSLTFAMAAKRFSDDKETKGNGGKIINPNTGMTTFEMSELGQIDPTLTKKKKKMKPGEITEPLLFTDPQTGESAYRIVQLINYMPPHTANLRDDYQRLQEAALNEKKNRLLENWIKNKIKNTYVRIDSQYKNCTFNADWSQKFEN